jgi:hypothetical protein
MPLIMIVCKILTKMPDSEKRTHHASNMVHLDIDDIKMVNAPQEPFSTRNKLLSSFFELVRVARWEEIDSHCMFFTCLSESNVLMRRAIIKEQEGRAILVVCDSWWHQLAD